MKPVLWGWALLAAAVLATVAYKEWEWRARVERADVADVASLPFARAVVARLVTRGTLHYELYVQKGYYHFAVSGRMDVAVAEPADRSLDRSPVTDTRLAREMIRYTVEDPGIADDFAAGERVLDRLPEGEMTLFFRRSDGRFTLILRGQEAERKRWFPNG